MAEITKVGTLSVLSAVTLAGEDFAAGDACNLSADGGAHAERYLA